MSEPAPVTIQYDDEIKVTPETVELYYDEEQGPDQVKWTIESAPPGTVAVVIRQTGVQAVEQILPGQPENGKMVVWGLENTRQEVLAKYEVKFLNNRGGTLAEVDPYIRNLPKKT